MCAFFCFREHFLLTSVSSFGFTIWKGNGRCSQDPSFPHFIFIVFVCSRAMHSVRAAVRFERLGIALVTPHLHKVKVQATLCKLGASNTTCRLWKLPKNF